MGPRPLGRGRMATAAMTTRITTRQWGRDLSAAEGRCPAWSTCSCGRVNGAATSRPRKVVIAAVAILVVVASMGPRPLGRGRMARVPPPVVYRHASMGPRPLGRGRLGLAGRDVDGVPWRQWGRDLSAAEGSSANTTVSCSGSRQWGRDLSAAEGFSAASKKAAEGRRQWGRDLSAAEGPCHRGRPPRRSSRQWGRDHSAAEGGSVGDMVRVPDRRQWGRDLSAAEGLKRASSVPSYRRASMGPRPLGRGRSVRVAWRAACPGVNGAATSRPRKADRHAAWHYARPQRQWGRDLSAAEGVFLCDGVEALKRRQWGRDLSAAEGPSQSPPRPWLNAASMGPRPLGRGRTKARCLPRASTRASMGPRPLGRGRNELREITSQTILASMGPRPLGRGRPGFLPDVWLK